MLALQRLVAAGALLAVMTSPLEAQNRGYIIPAPQGQPRVGGMAPPPAPAPTVHTYGYGYGDGYGYRYRPGVIRLGQTVFGSLPAFVTPDGRVLVNYGYGYEEVGRVCPGVYGYDCQSDVPIVNTPVYGAPSYAAPTYTAPVFGAPVYPTPVYPPSGYGQRGYALPTSGYGPDGSCPSGFVPTGGNPPCIDPARSGNGNVRPLEPAARPSTPRSQPSIRGGMSPAARPRPHAAPALPRRNH